MDRRSFLRRTAGLAALVLVGRPTLPEAAVAEPAALAPVADRLVASGGLCAPLTPYYRMPVMRLGLPSGPPVWEVLDLPTFQAERGGIEYDD